MRFASSNLISHEARPNPLVQPTRMKPRAADQDVRSRAYRTPCPSHRSHRYVGRSVDHGSDLVRQSTLTKEQKTSEFRQAWIDALREDLARFLGAARAFARAVEVLHQFGQTTRARSL